MHRFMLEPCDKGILLGCAAAPKRGCLPTHKFLPAVLTRMDRALHCERYNTPRPAYSMLLAALKLQLLTGSRDPIASIISQVDSTDSMTIPPRPSFGHANR